MNIFKQLFNNKKTELEWEEEIEKEVIDNNISIQNKTNICIIKYKVTDAIGSTAEKTVKLKVVE